LLLQDGDGPSGGCAIVSMLISLALQKPISQHLAMTGAIRIDDKVGRAVGGIGKKVAAAVEAGFEDVILPKDNKIDFEALPAEVKSKIKVHYAENYDDVYKIAFES
jgi:ATP-dependent Lon protease